MLKKQLSFFHLFSSWQNAFPLIGEKLFRKWTKNLSVSCLRAPNFKWVICWCRELKGELEGIILLMFLVNLGSPKLCLSLEHLELALGTNRPNLICRVLLCDPQHKSTMCEHKLHVQPWYLEFRNQGLEAKFCFSN